MESLRRMSLKKSKTPVLDMVETQNFSIRAEECLQIMTSLCDAHDVSTLEYGDRNPDTVQQLVTFLENKHKIEEFLTDVQQWFDAKTIHKIENGSTKSKRSSLPRQSSKGRFEDVDAQTEKTQKKPVETALESKTGSLPVQSRIPKPSSEPTLKRKSSVPQVFNKLAKGMGIKPNTPKLLRRNSSATSVKGTEINRTSSTVEVAESKPKERHKVKIEKKVEVVGKTTTTTHDVILQELYARLDKPIKESDLFRALTERNAELTDRLAEEMNSKISANESALENTSIKNRPTNIAEEYRLLIAQSWLDAKCALDQANPEEKYEESKIRLLRHIILVAGSEADRSVKEVVHSLTQSLIDPLEFYALSPHVLINGTEHKLSSESKENRRENQGVVSQSTVNSICDYFRLTADSTHLHTLFQHTREGVLHTYKHTHRNLILHHLKLAEVDSFLQQCARLAWKMALQRPPMVFDYSENKSRWEGQSDLDLAWGSKPDEPEARIKYYKYPSLYHGEMCMVKGMVYVD